MRWGANVWLSKVILAFLIFSASTFHLAKANEPMFTPLGDGMDEFCATVGLPHTIALCSDPELRALAVQRQRTFDEAMGRLTPDQQKTLLGGQRQWINSYAYDCGLKAPVLPLPPAVRDCMAGAGRTRIAYLKTYRRDAGAAPPIAANGPSHPDSKGLPLWPEGIYRNRPAPPTETTERDAAFRAQVKNVCADNSPRSAGEQCTQLQNDEPPCIAYHNFAWNYFSEARSTIDVAMPYERAQMLRAQMTRSFSDRFVQALEPLINIAYHTKEWSDPDMFATAAYDACMNGRLLGSPDKLTPLSVVRPPASRCQVNGVDADCEYLARYWRGPINCELKSSSGTENVQTTIEDCNARAAEIKKRNGALSGQGDVLVGGSYKDISDAAAKATIEAQRIYCAQHTKVACATYTDEIYNCVSFVLPDLFQKLNDIKTYNSIGMTPRQALDQAFRTSGGHLSYTTRTLITENYEQALSNHQGEFIWRLFSRCLEDVVARNN